MVFTVNIPSEGNLGGFNTLKRPKLNNPSLQTFFNWYIGSYLKYHWSLKEEIA